MDLTPLETSSTDLSRYVYYDPTRAVYYNSMTRKCLPSNATESEFREHLFLKGQELESLEAKLFRDPKVLQLRIIPTWECNLRCKHCSVLEKLKRRDPCLIDINQVLNFVRSHVSIYNTERVSLCFIGGESMLQPEFCLEILRATKAAFPTLTIASNLTTNLAFKLTKTAVTFLSELDSFSVSLDGDEEQHNWQRKSGEVENIYQATFNNLKRLALLGLAPKIKVQAAIQQEKFTAEAKIEFYKTLIRLGITSIDYGCVHPTKQKKEADEFYLNVLNSTQLFDIPCCDYRFMTHFIVNSDNRLYRSYYDHTQETLLGELSEFKEENPEYIRNVIVDKYKAGIRKDMAIYHDSTCMNSCPVVAYCWGRCVNNDLFTQKEPSKYCNKDDIHQQVQTMATTGELVKLYV